MFSTDVFEGAEMYGELLQANLEDTSLLACFEEGLIFSDVHRGSRGSLSLRVAGGSSPPAECPGYSTGQKHMRHFSLMVLTLIITSPAQERIYFSFAD